MTQEGRKIPTFWQITKIDQRVYIAPLFVIVLAIFESNILPNSLSQGLATNKFAFFITILPLILILVLIIFAFHIINRYKSILKNPAFVDGLCTDFANYSSSQRFLKIKYSYEYMGIKQHKTQYYSSLFLHDMEITQGTKLSILINAKKPEESIVLDLIK